MAITSASCYFKPYFSSTFFYFFICVISAKAFY